MLKKMLTKEVLGNAAVTLVVVMSALAIHDRFVKPMLAKKSTVKPTPPVVVDNSADEDED